jgi:hypothetical protein
VTGGAGERRYGARVVLMVLGGERNAPRIVPEAPSI